MNTKPPILVTGSHRSGTTWAGQMLCLSPHTAYVHEPFNIDLPFGPLATRPANWYHRVTEHEASLFETAFRDVIQFRYPLMHRLPKVRGPFDIARIAREQGRMLIHRIRAARPIVKDPLAFFSAEWLADAFDMQVLVMVRHPAAFCSSLMLKGWSFDFRNFRDQAALMEGDLLPFAAQITRQSDEPGDLLSQAILLWNCIHSTMLRYRKDRPDWLFVRHEDLSRAPVEGFQEIYASFGLEFSQEASQGISDATGSHNPSEQHRASEFRRNARANIDNWKRRLSADEIIRIREATQEIASNSYSDEDW